jgi:hypothetical protein
MTRFVPVFATAQNSRSSGDQHTLRQSLASEAVRVVHVVPSGDVLTAPAPPTAQNNRSSGDQQTDCTESAPLGLVVQAAPSSDVIVESELLLATAQKMPIS